MKRSLVILGVVVIVLGLALSGCDKEVTDAGTTSSSGPATTADGATETTAGGSTETSVIDATTTPPGIGPGPFATPQYLDSQPVDLAAITNLDMTELSDAQKEVLSRQSFVAVAEDPMAGGPWKFWHIYENARYQGLPLLITTDSLLNAYHMLFDTLLQRMEEAALYDQAVAMTEALFEAAAVSWETASDATVKEEARLNMAYFGVGSALLSGDPGDLAVGLPEVETELALIEGAAGLSESPILGYTEDYSQYKPRGHYTRSERLERYFKTLMWYGHTGFFINPRSPDVSEDEAVSLTRRAILVSSSLQGPALEAWKAIYEPTAFLVGRADDLTVDDMNTVLTEVYGTAQPAPDDLADEAKIAAVRQKLNELPAPKILTAAVRAEGDTENREANERSFRVMGQRYIPDSYAFQQLVWAYVGDASPPEAKRELPMGLDVMAVLGSSEAYKIATEDFDQDRYTNYESQLSKVYDEFSSKSGGLWPDNLYTGWLESLQEVMAFPADEAPDFMKSRAWARKSLNAALGSWTELRHDTILYAKQSVVAEGDGGEEPEVAGYVEPYPAFYNKIAGLAVTMRQSMDQFGLIDSEAVNKLDTMIELAETLANIAQKQLAGSELTAEERRTIVYYGSTLEWLEDFDDTSDQGLTLSPVAEKSPLVADVHTSYNLGVALEEATGYPLVLYAAFEHGGQLQVFCGASYSYYEFTAPLNERLTDEEWTEILDSGTAPPRPAWTNEWIAE